MITSETSYKLAEIIKDTWPQLFYLKKGKNKNDRINSGSAEDRLV